MCMYVCVLASYIIIYSANEGSLAKYIKRTMGTYDTTGNEKACICKKTMVYQSWKTMIFGYWWENSQIILTRDAIIVD